MDQSVLIDGTQDASHWRPPPGTKRLAAVFFTSLSTKSIVRLS